MSGEGLASNDPEICESLDKMKSSLWLETKIDHDVKGLILKQNKKIGRKLLLMKEQFNTFE